MDLEQEPRISPGIDPSIDPGIASPGFDSESGAVMRARPVVNSGAISWPVTGAQPVMPVIGIERQLRRRGFRRTAEPHFLPAARRHHAQRRVRHSRTYARYEILRGVTFTTAFVDVPFADFRTLEIIATVGMLAMFLLRGLYHLRTTASWFRQFWIIASSTTIAFAIYSAFDYVVRKSDLGLDNASRAVIIFAWVSVIVSVAFARLVVAGTLAFFFRRGYFLTNLLVVGSGRLGKLMMQQIAASPHLGYHVVGFIHDLDGPPTDFGRFKVLGTMRDLDAVIRGYHIADVIIALPSHQHQQILRTVRLCERAGADFRLVPDLYELSLSRIGVDDIEGIPLIGLRRSLTSTWQYAVKRAIDITIALGVLLVAAPVWLLIALAIKLDSPGPIFYRPMRLGYRGAPFPCSSSARCMRTPMPCWSACAGRCQWMSVAIQAQT